MHLIGWVFRDTVHRSFSLSFGPLYCSISGYCGMGYCFWKCWAIIWLLIDCRILLIDCMIEDWMYSVAELMSDCWLIVEFFWLVAWMLIDWFNVQCCWLILWLLIDCRILWLAVWLLTDFAIFDDWFYWLNCWSTVTFRCGIVGGKLTGKQEFKNWKKFSYYDLFKTPVLHNILENCRNLTQNL